MKRLLIALLVITCASAHAQDKSRVEGDTAYYMGQKVYVGQELRFAYGSNSNKDFVYVTFGSGLAGTSPLEASWSKRYVTVDKVYVQHGVTMVRAKMKEMKGPSKFYIDLEGAIDNKELF